jgi:hypothetical protein
MKETPMSAETLRTIEIDVERALQKKRDALALAINAFDEEERQREIDGALKVIAARGRRRELMEKIENLSIEELEQLVESGLKSKLGLRLIDISSWLKTPSR